MTIDTTDRKPLATAEQVSEYLGVPPGTVDAWRTRGGGPRFSRVGRHVRYRWADVDRWLDQQANEPGDAT
jgi:excisionase family DNA binding protein